MTGGEQGEQPLGVALEDIEQAMPRFARWMYATVKPALHNRVVDAGAGIGTYAEMLLADGHEVVALEYDGVFANQLAERFAGNRNVLVFQSDLCNSVGLPEFAAADSILCLNVLEHVPDDMLALRNMRERVKPGGSLALLVPACPRLLNSMDRAIGHYRRYSKAELEQKLAATGFGGGALVSLQRVRSTRLVCGRVDASDASWAPPLATLRRASAGLCHD